MNECSRERGKADGTEQGFRGQVEELMIWSDDAMSHHAWVKG